MSWFGFDEYPGDECYDYAEYSYEAGSRSGAHCRRCGRYGPWAFHAGNWRIEHQCAAAVARKDQFDVISDDDI